MRGENTVFHHAHHQEAPRGQKLRILDGLEEYFWLSENTFPRTTMMLAEVEGATTVEAWRDAFANVQERYPLLSARICKTPGKRPYFESLPGARLPLRVIRLEGASLDALIAQEPVTSFANIDAPLARLTLCHSAERSVVLFSAHHAACDGRTNVQIVEDLITAVSGAALADPLPLLPAIGEFFGLREPGPYAELCLTKAPSSTFRFSLPKPRVLRHLLPAKDLKALWTTARAEGTTVQGALVAAFFLAGRCSSQRWRTTPVVCFSPIDLRPMLSLSGAAGVLISVHPSVMRPSDNLPFWEFARVLKEDMRSSQTKEVTALGLNAAREVVQHEGDPDDLNTIDGKGFYNHDLMISNYGDPGVRTSFGHLTLKALYPSVITGDVNTQSISVLTVAGKLHITQISRRPFPSLVEDACAILLEASGVTSAVKAVDIAGNLSSEGVVHV
jgi:hypothetical protein